jgi:cytochrome c556
MKIRLILAAVSFLGVWAATGQSATPGPTLQHTMKSIVAVDTQIVWDVGNQAQDDKGDPDPTKLKNADWERIVQASQRVKQAAQSLAQADHLRVADPGQKIDGEGNPGAFNAQQVQGVIDASPQAFRAFAQVLAQSMEQITAAARSRDAVKLADLSGQVDEICEQCHTQFWYPQQKSKR